MMIVSIVYEDGKPIRVFKDDACIYSAYKWCHRHFCLDEINPELPMHKLPDWLEVKLYTLTEEQFNNLIVQ